MPTGVMSTIASILFSWIAARWTNRRCLVAILAACLGIIGAIIVYTVPRSNIGGQMVGIYLLYTYFGPYVVGMLVVFQSVSCWTRYYQDSSFSGRLGADWTRTRVTGLSLSQANTAGHTKKNAQYSILYIGYAVGTLLLLGCHPTQRHWHELHKAMQHHER